MSDPTLISDLVRAGVAPELIQRVVAELLFASADVTRTSVDASADERRRRDRERQKARRKMLKDQKEKTPLAEEKPSNTVTRTSADASADGHKDRPLTLFSSSESIQESPSKKVEDARARKRSPGTTLSADWHPSASHYAEAFMAGRSKADVDRIADGMRLWAKANSNRAVARKADWNATFTGWMRRELEKPNGKGQPNGVNGHHGTARRSAANDFYAGLASVAEDLDRDSAMAGASGPDIPRGRFEFDA